MAYVLKLNNQQTLNSDIVNRILAIPNTPIFTAEQHAEKTVPQNKCLQGASGVAVYMKTSSIFILNEETVWAPVFIV